MPPSNATSLSEIGCLEAGSAFVISATVSVADGCGHLLGPNVHSSSCNCSDVQMIGGTKRRVRRCSRMIALIEFGSGSVTEIGLGMGAGWRRFGDVLERSESALRLRCRGRGDNAGCRIAGSLAVVDDAGDVGRASGDSSIDLIVIVN